MKHRKKCTVLAAIILAAVVFAGLYWWYSTTDKYKAEKLVKELRAHYVDEDPDQFRQWFIDLGLIKDDGDKEPRDKEEIIKDLVFIGKPAVPALIEVLKDKNNEVRFQAAVVLVDIAPDATVEKTVPILIQGLKNVWLEDVLMAIEALGKIGPAAKAAVPALTEKLEAGHWEILPAVAETLGKIGPAAKAAVPALIKTLKNYTYFDADVRHSAAKALWQIAPAVAVEEAIPVLIKDLKNKDEYVVRHSAAETLWRIAPDVAVKEAIPVLIKDLKNHEDGEVDIHAALTLVDISPTLAVEKTVPIFIWHLDGAFYQEAAEALGKIGLAAVPALTELLKDKNEDVRQAAAEALKQINKEPEQKTLHHRGDADSVSPSGIIAN